MNEQIELKKRLTYHPVQTFFPLAPSPLHNQPPFPPRTQPPPTPIPSYHPHPCSIHDLADIRSDGDADVQQNDVQNTVLDVWMSDQGGG